MPPCGASRSIRCSVPTWRRRSASTGASTTTGWSTRLSEPPGSFLSCGGWPSTHFRWPRGGRSTPTSMSALTCGSSVRRATVRPPPSCASFETFVMDPFDASRPPWEIVVVEGMAAGQTAGVLKMSHVIADGVGWLLLLMQLFDLEEVTRGRSTAKGILRPGDGEGARTADVPEHSRPRVTDVAARACLRPDVVARRDDGPRGGDGPFIGSGVQAVGPTPQPGDDRTLHVGPARQRCRADGRGEGGSESGRCRDQRLLRGWGSRRTPAVSRSPRRDACRAPSRPADQCPWPRRLGSRRQSLRGVPVRRSAAKQRPCRANAVRAGSGWPSCGPSRR